MDARACHFDLATQSATKRLKEFGFDNEESLLAYIMSTQPQLPEAFRVIPAKAELAAQAVSRQTKSK